MAQVIHTVNVVYGSYSQDGVQITCDENDDIDYVKSKVKKRLDLNFLPMATFSVRIINTEYLED